MFTLEHEINYYEDEAHTSMCNKYLYVNDREYTIDEIAEMIRSLPGWVNYGYIETEDGDGYTRTLNFNDYQGACRALALGGEMMENVFVSVVIGRTEVSICFDPMADSVLFVYWSRQETNPELETAIRFMVKRFNSVLMQQENGEDAGTQ